jgi:hypothetical protein
MFEDSLSEGHVYWGRVAIALTAMVMLAYLASLI